MAELSRDDQSSASGRAGRNLASAIVVGLLLGFGLVLLPIVLAPWIFSFVVAFAMVGGAHELHGAMASRGIRLVRLPLYIGVFAMVEVAYWYGPLPFLAVFAATVLLSCGLRLRRGPDGFVADVAATVFAASYTGLLGGFAALTLASSQGGGRVLTFVILTICSDVGGYAAGVLAGRHPIAPSLSPKKSWEGFVGSLLLQAIAGVLLFTLLLHAPWWQGLITGLVLTVTATVGDFVESAVKRDLGVKDLSSVLPGHGGLMDRFDSLLPNAFASWLLLRVFLGP